LTRERERILGSHQKASELVSDEVTSESLQQQEPDLQMNSNICSNISFDISLRNLSNQKSYVSENLSFFSEDSTFVVQPLNEAAPSNTIMIDSDSDEEDSIICDQPSTSSQNPEHSTEPD